MEPIGGPFRDPLWSHLWNQRNPQRVVNGSNLCQLRNRQQSPRASCNGSNLCRRVQPLSTGPTLATGPNILASPKIIFHFLSKKQVLSILSLCGPSLVALALAALVALRCQVHLQLARIHERLELASGAVRW